MEKSKEKNLNGLKFDFYRFLSYFLVVYERKNFVRVELVLGKFDELEPKQGGPLDSLFPKTDTTAKPNILDGLFPPAPKQPPC